MGIKTQVARRIDNGHADGGTGPFGAALGAESSN